MTFGSRFSFFGVQSYLVTTVTTVMTVTTVTTVTTVSYVGRKVGFNYLLIV